MRAGRGRERQQAEGAKVSHHDDDDDNDHHGNDAIDDVDDREEDNEGNGDWIALH